MSFTRSARICCLILVTALYSQHSFAQQEPQNIILDKGLEEYRFEQPRKGGRDFIIVRNVRNEYRCQLVSDTYGFGQLFDENSEITDFVVHVDGYRRHDIQPEFRAGGDAEQYQTARRCELRLPFSAQGMKADLAFQQRFRDPRLTGYISLFEDLPLKSKTVVIRIPDWLDLRITEWNFEGKLITHQVEKRDHETVHSYEIRDYAVPAGAADAISGNHIMPHLVLEYHTARLGDELVTYFPGTAELYGYYRTMLDSSASGDSSVKALATSLTKGLGSDKEKVRAIYSWVQSNIHYVAFEDGIAGLKPDKAASILRKKYADCKGMSTLLVSMIRSIGLQASHCWIGTNDRPYDYSLHSMCVDNHMIAAWLDHGKPVYLDATANWIAFGDLREDIQGRQTLRENGTGFMVEAVPSGKAAGNLDLEQRTLKLDNGVLHGQVKHTLTGQSKYALLAALHTVGNTNTEKALLLYVSGKTPDYAISNLVTSDLSDRDGPLTISYDVVQKNALNSFDSELYLDADNRKLAIGRFDTLKREVAYQHSYKTNCRLEVSITLPSVPGKCQLPDSISLRREDYGFAAGWRLQGTTLLYHAGYWTERLQIPVSAFTPVNTDFDKLRAFYARQPELHF